MLSFTLNVENQNLRHFYRKKTLPAKFQHVLEILFHGSIKFFCSIKLFFANLPTFIFLLEMTFAIGAKFIYSSFDMLFKVCQHSACFTLRQVWLLQTSIENATNGVLIHSEYYGSLGQAMIAESINLWINFKKFYSNKPLSIFLFDFLTGSEFHTKKLNLRKSQ